MSTETMERLPNTVTRCHEEIRRLRASQLAAPIVVDNSEQIAALKADIGELTADLEAAETEKAALEASVKELEAERDELKERLEATEKEKEEADERIEENEHPNAILAIDDFLGECERIGPMRFDVPQSDRVNRAIVALHDVVGRNP
jgi:septal ring factor EnvC (AmiA/AmiB activator)